MPLILEIVAVVLLALLVLMVFRALRGGLVGDIERAIKRLGDASAHYVEVNAVLALTKHFKNDPELMPNLAGYSRQVVGATLFLRVNTLSEDIARVQKELSKSRGYRADGGSALWQHYSSEISKLEADLADLFKQLNEAEQAVHAFTGLRAVS